MKANTFFYYIAHILKMKKYSVFTMSTEFFVYQLQYK